jgi:hypothetical protein
MTAEALIKEALDDGLKLKPCGGKLRLIGMAEVVEKWKPRIIASKADILATLELLPRSSWWVIWFSDRTQTVYADPPINQFDLLESRPGAVAAQPISAAAPPTTVTSCSACAHATYRGGCGQPVEAGLSGQSGVIAYHPAGGADCATWAAVIPPDLELLIQESATKWQWSDDDMSPIQRAAQFDPAGLRIAFGTTPSLKLGIS